LAADQAVIEVYRRSLVRILRQIGEQVEDYSPARPGVGLDQMLRSLTGDSDILPRLQREFQFLYDVAEKFFDVDGLQCNLNPSYVQTAEGEEIIQNISQVVNR